MARAWPHRQMEEFVRLALVAGLFVTLSCEAQTEGTLIPADQRVDMVYDPPRDILYVTNGASVLRYHIGSDSFLQPFVLGVSGTSLRGIDLSADGNTLAVADGNYAADYVWVHLIDLETGSRSKPLFPRDWMEGGTFTVAYGNDGCLLVTSSFQGSGWVPMRRYDPATEEVTNLCGVRQDTMLRASADGSVIGFAESNSSAGPVGRYRVADGDLLHGSGTGWSNYEIAANWNGTQYAVPTYGGTFIYNGNMEGINKIGEYAGEQPIGVVYHPVHNTVYFAWSGTTEVRAHSTFDFTLLATYDFEHVFGWPGNHAFAQGRLRIARDGSLLFATVSGGVRYVWLAPRTPPELAWLGVGRYETDGVDPDRGPHLAWFTFKVQYTGDPPTYVRLHLFRYGVQVAGSPYDLHAGSGQPATGQTFWFKRRLCKGTYSYYFSASDGVSSATGEPTQEHVGPVVGNRPPRLEWAGTEGFETDGIDPQGRQLPGTEITWKVKYIDREGHPPEYVRVHVARKVEGVDQEIEGSPFSMMRESGEYISGAIYGFSRLLNTEGRYAYWFSAMEQPPPEYTPQAAYGVPSWWHRHMLWIFNIPPRLTWAPGEDYRGDDPPDGLHPNTGSAGATFTFKVQYRDPEGRQPVYMRLHLLKWNGSEFVEIAGSPHNMSTAATQFDIADYAVSLSMHSAGRYRYYFAANDGGKDAIGEPSWRRMLGPIVNGAQSAGVQISGLSCCTTRAGAQATFALSGDAEVTVEVTNIAGRLVKVLVANKPMIAGTNTLVWDGRSDRGMPVPSGVYVVKIRAGDEKGGRAQVLGAVRIER